MSNTFACHCISEGDKIRVMPNPYSGPHEFPKRQDDKFPTGVTSNVLINADNESLV